MDSNWTHTLLSVLSSLVVNEKSLRITIWQLKANEGTAEGPKNWVGTHKAILVSVLFSI